MKKTPVKRALSVLTMVAMTAGLTGCELNDFLNPGEPHILDKGKPLVVPILDTLASGIEEPDTGFANATDIEPEDLVPDVADYQIGQNDLVNVSIFDLLGEGTGETVKTVRVTETGSISLPFIPPIKATGLTEHQLEGAVSKAYEDAKLIRSARVSVTVAEARGRTFSIQGNVTGPGEYQITRPDFRMLDAMVTARAPQNPLNVEYAFVIRHLKSQTVAPDTGNSGTPAPSDNSNMGSTPATQPSGTDLLAPPTTQSRLMPLSHDQRAMLMDQPAMSGKVFKFDDVQAPTDVRVIRVPIDQLRQHGELKYNIIVRPNDMIIVPDPVTGIYYAGGHLLHPGVFSLSGASVTLKDAWVAAGGADDFTFPGRTELIRRVGANKEVFVRVNMGKIWSGEEPDIFLKPNDMMVAGTHFIAPFLAAARNSFRLTYGFGFLYDRNFYQGPNGF